MESLLDWFRGPEGERRLVEELKAQPLVKAQADLAHEIARTIRLEEVPSGTVLIDEGAPANDSFWFSVANSR